MAGTKHVALLALAVFAVAVAVFAPSAGYEFVRMDDHEYVTENRHIEHGLSMSTAIWALSDVGYASNWHPLAWISHAADVSLARALGWIGDAPGWDPAAWVGNDGGLARLSHAHNVMLHGLNAALLFLVMVLVGRSGSLLDEGPACRGSGLELAAAAAAVAWAVHPLRCEAVCWVSERKELLSVFWMLASFALWLKAEGSADSRPVAALCGALSLLAFAFALMSKPVAVSLPAVIFAHRWMLRGGRFMDALRGAMPFAVMSAIACALTLSAQAEALESGRQYDWLMRLECAIEAPAVYLRQTLLPVGLSPVYLRGRETDWALLAAGCVVMAAMCWAVSRWIRRREGWCGDVAFGVVWAYVALVPMLGLVKVGGMAHSDRYTYWPGCGVAVAVALVAARAAGCRAHPLTLGSATFPLILVMAILGAMGMERSSHWRDTVALYRDTVAKSHDAEIAFELADELMRRSGGRAKREAEAMLREVASANPDPKAYAALAHFLAFRSDGARMVTEPEAGGFSEPRALAGRALAEDPGCWIAHAALTACDARDGRWSDAVVHGESAIRCGAKDAGFAELVAECRGKVPGGDAGGGR